MRNRKSISENVSVKNITVIWT